MSNRVFPIPFVLVLLVSIEIAGVADAEPRGPAKSAQSKKPLEPSEIEYLHKVYEVIVTGPKSKESLKYVPGYFDTKSRTFYALKGIVFDHYPDKFSPLRRTLELTAGKETAAKDKYSRREIDPPIVYLTVGKDKFVPGLYAPRWKEFYRWKGITLAADELPEKDPKKPYTVLPEKPKWHTFYEISAPKYLLDKPELWKKVKKAGQ